MTKTLLKNVFRLVIIAFVLVVASRSVSAQWPYFGGGYWCGGDGYYSNYSQETVPYYALHPPVYYSYPIARTYGLLPFPYYFEPFTYSLAVVEPRTVLNRYVEQRLATETRTIGPQPLMVINPFVEQSVVSETAGEANWEQSNVVKPKVVYPIKLTSVN